MKLPDWREKLRDWLTDTCDWFQSFSVRPRNPFRGLSRGIGQLLGHAQLVSWLSFLAATAAAIATYYSYLASQQSADVSAKAQAFTERTNQEQIALARPVLSAMSGRFDSWIDGEGYQRRTKQRLELIIRNSGARSALPAWVAVYQANGVPSAQRFMTVIPWQLAHQAPDIPSSSDVKVTFDLSGDQPPDDLLVALAYADDAPRQPGVVAAPEEPPLQKRCIPPKVVWLHSARAPQGQASAPGDWVVTSAVPLPLLSEATADGRTEAEAAAAHLWAQMREDVRCGQRPGGQPG